MLACFCLARFGEGGQQIIDTVAGGNWPNGIPATQAGFGSVQSVATDASGNLYIATTSHQRIYRVEGATGVITTVAGTGTQGFSGDNIPATTSQLANPRGVALDSLGNLFIADQLNQRVRVVLTNQPPVANGDGYSTNENTAFNAPAPGVLGNDTDVDSPALTATLVSGTSNGTLTFSSNGSFTYVPNANFFGTDSFTYKANDGFLDSNVATVTITVNAVNDAPVAGNNSYSVDENTTLNIVAPGVLANDTDIDSASLTAVLTAGPANGTLTLNPNGSFTYTPNANFVGSDSFTYKANDGFLDSNVATVTITVNFVDNTPPDTTITQAPPVLTNSTGATFAFVSSEPVGATFLYSLDNAEYTTCSSGIIYSPLAAGSHIFRVAAVDAAGNVDQSPAEHSWTIDIVAPNTTFTGTPPNLTSSTSARFDFTSTEGGSAFECSLDSAAYASCSSPTILNGLASGNHTFDVRATDAAGNTDPSPASKTWTIDANPPTLTNFIVGTPAVDTTNGPANVVTTVTATDDLSGVNTPTVNMTSPSGLLRSGTCALTGGTLLNRTYQCTGVLPQCSESGGWQFSVQLKDMAGSTVTLTSAQILAHGVALSATQLNATGAVGGNQIAGTFTYTPAAGTVLNAGNGQTLHVDFVPTDTVNYANTSKDVFINVLRATPTVSVTGGTFEFDGNPKAATGFAYGVGGVGDVLSLAVTLSYVGTGSTTYGPTATAPSARETFSVTASFAGNANYLSASNSAALTIQDTTGPVFTTLSTPPQYTNLTNVTFDFQTNETSTFACRLDGGAFAACASPQTYSALGDGLHTFEVRATDVSGNLTSASRSWTVDTVAPVITITTPANGSDYLLGSAVATNYGCSDALSPIASCVGTVANGGNFDTSSMGPKIFTVNASDQAGNTAGLSVTYNIVVPDLLEASVTNPPVSAFVGAQFDVTDKAQNLGNGPSGPSTTRYYLSLTQQQTNSGAILLGGSRSNPALTTAGSSNSFQGTTTVTILAGTPLGTYYLLACADDLAEVIESNEVNNCLASTGTVQIALPDLIETNLSNPPSTITPGMTFSVTDRVQNSTVPAGPSTARYYLSTAPQKNGSEILLGARSVPAIDANGQGSRSQATVDLMVPSGTPLGTYYLLACADDANQVAESNETNNCLAAANSTQFALPDLMQTSITNPPAAATVGTSFSVTDQVENQGAVAAQASTTRYYLSTTQQRNGTAVLLTGSRSIPALTTNGKNSRSSGTVTVTIPNGIATGTYYLLACADDLNNNSEANETNNCVPSGTAVAVN